MRLLLGAIAGVGVLSWVILDDAMSAFQHNRENSGEPDKKFWRIFLMFRFLPVSSAYFWFVYRAKMQEAGFLRHS